VYCIRRQPIPSRAGGFRKRKKYSNPWQFHRTNNFRKEAQLAIGASAGGVSTGGKGVVHHFCRGAPAPSCRQSWQTPNSTPVFPSRNGKSPPRSAWSSRCGPVSTAAAPFRISGRGKDHQKNYGIRTRLQRSMVQLPRSDPSSSRGERNRQRPPRRRDF